MKKKEQVANLELSRKLKELGIKQESLFFWVQVTRDVHGESHPWLLIDEEDLRIPRVFEKEGRAEIISAFTVAELGKMLQEVQLNGNPLIIVSYRGNPHWYCEPKQGSLNYLPVADTEANARAKMLIYLIEHKLLKTNY